MDRLRTLAKRWAAAADPEADERGYKAATEREFFDVSPTTGGCHLSGFLTTAHSQGLLVALQAVQGVLIDYPTLRSLATTAGVAHQINPALLLHSPLVGGPLNPAVLNPAVLNPAVFEDGQVVPRVVLDKLMCDAEISRFMFAADSQIINIGRTKRTFTGQLRRAIIARDKHCQFPRCTAPPRRCEGHHSQH